ncbi:hypothetical protein DR999_PMT18798 [Platysternon megacephalum]|uniref:Uncharacterized protein n=1 Tax=Platysternon megacephalum TaxID=55544 RepID=A0A4D9DPH5_9SAUR|nr:hypothetical protein DR999_PMT18798 [Platysternon megacephalum]
MLLGPLICIMITKTPALEVERGALPVWYIGTQAGLGWQKGLDGLGVVTLAAYISAPLTLHTPLHAVHTVYSCECKRARGRGLQNVATPCHTPVNQGVKASPTCLFRMSIYK